MNQIYHIKTGRIISGTVYRTLQKLNTANKSGNLATHSSFTAKIIPAIGEDGKCLPIKRPILSQLDHPSSILKWQSACPITRSTSEPRVPFTFNSPQTTSIKNSLAPHAISSNDGQAHHCVVDLLPNALAQPSSPDTTHDKSKKVRWTDNLFTVQSDEVNSMTGSE